MKLTSSIALIAVLLAVMFITYSTSNTIPDVDYVDAAPDPSDLTAEETDELDKLNRQAVVLSSKFLRFFGSDEPERTAKKVARPVTSVFRSLWDTFPGLKAWLDKIKKFFTKLVALDR